MSYYIRAFCTALEVPDLETIQVWLRERGSKAVIDEVDHAFEAAEAGEIGPSALNLADSDWEQVALVYRAGKLPILAECNRDDGSEDCLMREGGKGVRNLFRPFAVSSSSQTEKVPDTFSAPESMRVRKHLAETKFVVACQLPTADIEEDGYDANGDFLTFFTEHCGGMIQADGEGFYDGQRLLLELD